MKVAVEDSRTPIASRWLAPRGRLEWLRALVLAAFAWICFSGVEPDRGIYLGAIVFVLLAGSFVAWVVIVGVVERFFKKLGPAAPVLMLLPHGLLAGLLVASAALSTVFPNFGADCYQRVDLCSPSGKYIGQLEVVAPPTWTLVIRRADGSRTWTLPTSHSSHHSSYWSWGPDDRFLVYDSDVGSREWWQLDATGRWVRHDYDAKSDGFVFPSKLVSPGQRGPQPAIPASPDSG